jgi:transketolase
MRGAMFFGPRKQRHSADGVSHPSDPASHHITDQHSEQWHAWRSAAQRATRAWNEWLAADRRERPELYRCYLLALNREEQAAVAIEQAVSRDTTTPDTRDTASKSDQELAG